VFLHVFFMSVLLLVLDVYMFCDVCRVGMSLTVSIFSTPPPLLSHFYTTPHPFTLTALITLIPIWARFSLYYFTLHVPLLSPLCPLQVVWGFLGALLECVGDPRPVNVVFALLIFTLVFFLVLI
jgi:hypothetical protein